VRDEEGGVEPELLEERTHKSAMGQDGIVEGKDYRLGGNRGGGHEHAELTPV
jgi:hypothetical protein